MKGGQLNVTASHLSIFPLFSPLLKVISNNLFMFRQFNTFQFTTQYLLTITDRITTPMETHLPVKLQNNDIFFNKMSLKCLDYSAPPESFKIPGKPWNVKVCFNICE